MEIFPGLTEFAAENIAVVIVVVVISVLIFYLARRGFDAFDRWLILERDRMKSFTADTAANNRLMSQMLQAHVNSIKQMEELGKRIEQMADELSGPILGLGEAMRTHDIRAETLAGEVIAQAEKVNNDNTTKILSSIDELAKIIGEQYKNQTYLLAQVNTMLGSIKTMLKVETPPESIPLPEQETDEDIEP